MTDSIGGYIYQPEVFSSLLQKLTYSPVVPIFKGSLNFDRQRLVLRKIRLAGEKGPALEIVVRHVEFCLGWLVRC